MVELDKWLLLGALLLILIDLFFSSDLPTFIAFVLVTIWFYRRLPAWHILLRLSICVVVFFVLVFIYYFIWNKFKKHIIDKWFAKDLIRTGVDALVGETGTVRIIDGVQAAKIHGDLYSFVKPVSYADGTSFTVKAVENGMIVPEFKDITD